MSVNPVSLDVIRAELIRLEETIIFGLIERSQFAHNEKVYTAGSIIPDTTFLDHFLLETEKVHASMRRYTSPDEHPFFPGQIGGPIIPSVATSTRTALPENEVNLNAKLKDYYISTVLPRLCPAGDDTHYGSAALNDITLLQAISKRVHLGKYVAEAKIQQHEAAFREMVAAGDLEGVMAKLTHADVELRLLARVRAKVRAYAVDIQADGVAEESPLKVDPETVVGLYRDWIIPLTKDVEVEYIVHRLQ